MARTSKKANALHKKQETQAHAAWRAGIYARLSVDADSKKNESIDTQIAIAKEYIRAAVDMEYVDCYVDLGKTGTHFRREAFERMMADIRRKRINCVVVKDASRFGRNYIETGNYIEKVFPLFHIRFIAVTDGYDSGRQIGEGLQLSMNLKHIVNELYAKDISQRVRKAKQIRRQAGGFTGGVAPYGYYNMHVGGKNVLYPQEATKDVVVKMFEMYAAGCTYREIAQKLYEDKIQRPSVYRATNAVYGPPDATVQPWPYDTIKNILKNPAYTGMLLPGVHTHERLIDEALHKKVLQRMARMQKYCTTYSQKPSAEPSIRACMQPSLQSSTQPLIQPYAQPFKKGQEIENDGKDLPLYNELFRNKLFCGGCGSRLLRHSMKKKKGGICGCYYTCSTKRKPGKNNCQGISSKALETVLKEVLNKELALSQNIQAQWRLENARAAQRKRVAVRKQKLVAARGQERLAISASRLYARYREGKLSREEFLQKKAEEADAQEQWKRRDEELVRQEQEIDDREKEIDDAIGQNHIRQLLNGIWETSAQRLVDEKTNAPFPCCLAEGLVKSVTVHPGRRVELIFNYHNSTFKI